MTARKRSLPSLNDAGKMVYQLSCHDCISSEEVTKAYNLFSKDLQKHYVKLAIEIWREVERCL